MPNFRQLATSEILATKAEWFADSQHKDSIHGIAHMTRVAFYAQILGQYFGLNQKEMEIVLKSAITHDTQRVNDRWDEGHGDRAGIWFKTSVTAEELREDMSDEDIEAVAELNKYHETRPDQIPVEIQEKYGRLLKVIRLADAFDRFRSPHMLWWPKKEFLLIDDEEFLQKMYNFACYFSIVSEYERFLYGLDEKEAIIAFGKRVKAVKDTIESTIIFEEDRELILAD